MLTSPKPGLRQRRQFERQLRDNPPCLGRSRIAESTAERDVREDRHAERAVAAVDGSQRCRNRGGFETAGLPANPGGSPLERGRHAVAADAAVGHCPECRPTEQRGGEVALAGHGVAPAAVGQLRGHEPLHTSLDPRSMDTRINEPQGVDRRRRGERARRESPDPVTGGRPAVEQCGHGRATGGVKCVGPEDGKWGRERFFVRRFQ
jgi:hypothetical protein